MRGQHRRFSANSRHRLRHFVVQFTRQRTSFVLLCGEQSLRQITVVPQQFLHLLLRAYAFSDFLPGLHAATP